MVIVASASEKQTKNCTRPHLRSGKRRRPAPDAAIPTPTLRENERNRHAMLREPPDGSRANHAAAPRAAESPINRIGPADPVVTAGAERRTSCAADARVIGALRRSTSTSSGRKRRRRFLQALRESSPFPRCRKDGDTPRRSPGRATRSTRRSKSSTPHGRRADAGTSARRVIELRSSREIPG